MTRQPWTRARVIANIQAGAATRRRGIGPEGFITKQCASAAVHRFGSLRAAIAAAGVDADGVLVWKRRSAPKLRVEVEQLKRERPAMTPTEFHFHKIGRSLRALFGSEKAALRLWGVRDWPVAARALAEPQRARGYWSAERVVASIRERHRKREPLELKLAPEKLVAAAKTYIGSWRAAIERAGLDYDAIRTPVQTSVVQRTGHGWTRAYVLAELRRIHREGKLRMTSTVLTENGHSGLVTACLRLYGSFVRARELAGVPAPGTEAPSKSSAARDDIMRAILERARAGGQLHATAVPQAFYLAARSAFGSWDAALNACGIDPATVRRKRANWSREEVLAAIREAVAACEGKHGSARLPKAVALLAKNRFGTVRAALEAAAVDPDAVLRTRGRPWGPRDETTLRAQLDRLAQRRPNMTIAELREHALGRAIAEQVGSIEKVLRTWNLLEWPIRPRVPHSRANRPPGAREIRL